MGLCLNLSQTSPNEIFRIANSLRGKLQEDIFSANPPPREPCTLCSGVTFGALAKEFTWGKSVRWDIDEVWLEILW